VRKVFFYKRAQILAGDIWAAYGKHEPPHPFGFSDIDKLTMFADYRVPQILRAKGVLRYAPGLAARIDRLEVIPFASDEEVQIRAATVQAVERLKAEIELLSGGGSGVKSIYLDWLLWQEGEKVKDAILPHHRTLTVFY
jgi:hypothetical protein